MFVLHKLCHYPSGCCGYCISFRAMTVVFFLGVPILVFIAFLLGKFVWHFLMSTAIVLF